jgi:glycosyltransferase involved in cell wall biosynthesis
MHATKIGFVLLSNSNDALPSTRISVLTMLPYLRQAGYEPKLVFDPPVSTETPHVSGLTSTMLEEGIRIAYFQKVHGPSVLEEVRTLSQAGIKTIYGVCDLIDNEMVKATDATIVVTDYLKQLHDAALHHKIHVVHDGIERPDVQKRYDSWPTGIRRDTDRPLRAILVTSSELDTIPIIEAPPKFVEVTIVGAYPPVASWVDRAKRTYWKTQSITGIAAKLRHAYRISRRRFRAVNWAPNLSYDLMVKADVGILPVDMRPDPDQPPGASFWQKKSENRLTMKMAVGLPVVASPVPSYKSIIEQGMNGYIADGRSDWMAYFDALRDPELRKRVGERARASVIHRFSREAQARLLISVLDRVGGAT